MKTFLFAKRNAKEILRDPLSLCFGLGFPLILLILLSVINMNIPPEANNVMYAIDRLAPGVAGFGSVFMALFAGMLLAKDRTSSFLIRLFTSPMKPFDFIAGYTLPMLVISVAQSVITLAAALLWGLEFSPNIFLAVAVLIPVSFLYTGIGLLCGCVMSDKAVGGVCGALLTNLSGWLSGVWFPLELVGGTFLKIAKFLPFYHAAESARVAISGDFDQILLHLGVVAGYAVVTFAASVLVFWKKMRKGH